MIGVIHFKKQRFIDLQLLQLSIYYWNKYYDFEMFYIVGQYNDYDIREIHSLGLNILTDKVIKILNINNTNTRKDFILNNQVIEAYNYIQKPFISIHIDVFPLQELSFDDLNKEYKIKGYYNDFTPRYEFEELQLKCAKHFKEELDLDDIEIYENHYFYYINEEFVDFLSQYKNDYNYPLLLSYYNQYIKDETEDIFVEDLIGITYSINKYVYDETKNYKGINLTVPGRVKKIDSLYYPITMTLFQGINNLYNGDINYNDYRLFITESFLEFTRNYDSKYVYPLSLNYYKNFLNEN